MSMRKWAQRIAAALAALAMVGAGACVLAERYRARDYLPRFRQQKAELVSVSETVLESTPGHSLVHVALTDEHGLVVDGNLRVPSSDGGRRPVLLILGGVQTGRQTVSYLGNTGEWLVLALDYPYDGPRSGLSRRQFVLALPKMRRAVMDTVPAGMLAVDYLWRRPDVDRERVVLAGGSFGALFSPALGAADSRISAVAIFFGAGNLEALIDANLDLAWPLKPLATWLGSMMVSPLEPLKYIGRISPRPVFMLNGTDDAAMPAECSEALHEAAHEPKSVRWLSVGHVDVRSTEFHRQVVDEFTSWLCEIGFVAASDRPEFVPQP